MSGTGTAFSVGLHCCHWTRVPALGTSNADSGTLAHQVGPRPLDEEVDALSGPAMSRMVGSILRSKLQSKFADPEQTKEDPKVRAALSIRRSCFSGGGGVSNLCTM